MMLNVELEFFFLGLHFRIILENSLHYYNLFMEQYSMISNLLIQYLSMFQIKLKINKNQMNQNKWKKQMNKKLQ